MANRKLLPKPVAKYIQVSGGHWRWRGPVTADGYPQVSVNAKTLKALPFIFKLYYDLPEKRKLRPKSPGVDCHAKLCVNPDHYELAPVRPKIQMPGVGKGRNPAGWLRIAGRKGEENGRAKLTTLDVRRMRQLRRLGNSVSGIARHFDLVSRQQILRVLRKENWQHLED